MALTLIEGLLLWLPTALKSPLKQFCSGIHLITVRKWANTEDHVVGKYFVWEHSKQKAYPLKDNIHLTHNLGK